jgi:hypothetical protein
LWKKVLVAGAAVVLVAGAVSTPTSVYAGGTIKADDDKWISVGMGIRTSFNAVENGSANGHEYSNDFKVDNARIYINGSIHKYVKFTFNTDCFNCGVGGGSNHFAGNSNIGLIDAIGKFEFDEKFNIWFGRTLMPSERGELNGPFYHATFDGFRTPFFPADYSGNFPSGTTGASGGQGGLYGRDNGVVFFGKFHPFGTHLLYAAAVSTGVRGGPNRGNSLMYTGRLQWNLLNDEDNPGYYTSGTYYGTAGDIVAIAGNVQHQKDGAGADHLTNGAISDFTGLSVDLLIEKLLPNNMGVFTFNGEFKRFFANYGTAAFDSAGCFCVFNGDSWSVNALYLIPQQVGIGRFQPYVRFVSIDPRYSALRQEFEYGVNYIISGHNARISAYGRYGDINSKGFVNTFDPGREGDKIDSFHVALQMQY